MRVKILSSIIVVAGAWGLSQASAAAKIERYAQDGWVLTINRDSFTGRTRCLLRSTNGRMLYQPAALGFRFDRHLDTLGAWYWVDDGSPIRWQDRYPALVASGARIDGPGLDNPTGGIVWIPIEELAAARAVTVRARSRGSGHMFKVSGFAGMVDAGRRLGCGADANYAS